MSLKFKIDQDLMEKKTKTLATGKRARTVFNLSPCPLKTATNSVYINLQIYFTTQRNPQSKGKKIEFAFGD